MNLERCENKILQLQRQLAEKNQESEYSFVNKMEMFNSADSQKNEVVHQLKKHIVAYNDRLMTLKHVINNMRSQYQE